MAYEHATASVSARSKYRSAVGPNVLIGLPTAGRATSLPPPHFLFPPNPGLFFGISVVRLGIKRIDHNHQRFGQGHVPFTAHMVEHGEYTFAIF